MAYSKHHKRAAMHRKLQALSTTSSPKKAMKRNCSITKTFLHVYQLKNKLESIATEYSNLMAIKTEFLNLINHFHVPTEVKVEKIGRGFLVRVWCEKRQDRLVSILEAFDKMGVNVVRAKVSCKYLFSMEAIVVAPPEEKVLDSSEVTRALLKVIGSQVEEEKHQGSLEIKQV